MDLENHLERKDKLQMGNPTAAKYGRYYWCVKSKLSKSGEIYVMADRVEFTPSGGVIFWCDPSENDGDDKARSRTVLQTLALAAGQWMAVFAASCMDGHAVAVEHWKGEIVESAD